MESRSYMFSSGKKRSSQVASTAIYFPREEESAPRSKIIQKECPEEYKNYKSCVTQYGEIKCGNQKETMNECGKVAFRMVNTSPNYQL